LTSVLDGLLLVDANGRFLKLREVRSGNFPANQA
jgi:hypothetical protein